jgi:hypothetical protein
MTLRALPSATGGNGGCPGAGVGGESEGSQGTYVSVARVAALACSEHAGKYIGELGQEEDERRVLQGDQTVCRLREEAWRD